MTYKVIYHLSVIIYTEELDASVIIKHSTHIHEKILLCLAFFIAWGAGTVQANDYPDRDRIIRRYDPNRVYRDDRGEYHWQVIVREVWIPEQWVGGIFGSRRIPGHYEQRQQRVKIYHYSNRYNNNDRYSGKR